MNLNIIFAGITLTCLTFNTAAAQGRGLRSENRKIRQGLISGQLTKPEAMRLKLQETRLRREAICYKMNDGQIDPVERRDLIRDKRRLDRNIYIQKHDGQTRY